MKQKAKREARSEEAKQKDKERWAAWRKSMSEEAKEKQRERNRARRIAKKAAKVDLDESSVSDEESAAYNDFMYNLLW